MKYLIIILICLLSVNCYASTLREISDEICEGLVSDTDKIVALREAVYKQMQPYGNGYSLKDVNNHSLEWAWEHGIGWCNHQASVFMLLAREQGITTRLLYLLTADKSSSPHTIAEAKLGNKWVVVDVGNNLDFRYYGELATRNDMNTDFQVVLNNPKVKGTYDEDYWRMFTNPCYLIRTLEP